MKPKGGAGEIGTGTAMLRGLCPRCRSGRIYPSSIAWGFPKMHERCPNCGLLFEREAGYFLGAMYISFPLGVLVIGLASTLVWAVTGWSLERSVVLGVVLFLPLVPLVTQGSRILWIYLDQAIDPDSR